MSKGAVTRIIDFSAVDGPGNRLVIFLQGCNFNCWYCHNPETIPMPGGGSYDPEHPPVYEELSVEAVVKRYLKAKPFIAGVTISGGECTVQFQFLLALCSALKGAGAHILIDTNGHLGEEKLLQLLDVIDGVMLDVKAVGPEAHHALTGVGNEKVIQTFYTALGRHQLAEVRTVIRGEEPDALETVAWVAHELVSADPQVPYRLIRYRVHGVRKAMLPGLKPPSDALMERCKEFAEAAGLNNVILT